MNATEKAKKLDKAYGICLAKQGKKMERDAVRKKIREYKSMVRHLGQKAGQLNTEVEGLEEQQDNIMMDR